jgi:acetylglutamate kinase
MIDQCQAIIEALPYFQKFCGKTIVIKYGGSAQIEPELRSKLCEDLVLMQTLGIRTVLIHGGGPEISGMMKRLGKTAQFIEGLRVTDEETAEITEMVLVGKINKALAAEINLAGGRAVGLSGRDGNLVRAVKAKPVMVNGESIDLGLVGVPQKIDATILGDLLKCGYVPVVAPTGMAPDGSMLNINGDTAASYIAGALAAEKLIFLTDQKGLLRDVKDPESIISTLTLSQIEELKGLGIISGGMIPKMEAARMAIENDVSCVHIIDGRVPHSILLELFTSTGVGTMITRH